MMKALGDNQGGNQELQNLAITLLGDNEENLIEGIHSADKGPLTGDLPKQIELCFKEILQLLNSCNSFPRSVPRPRKRVRQ
jgi:hypothetical protein